MSVSFFFNAYDAAGALLTGAAGGMSFVRYIDDLGSALTPPAITEVGNGQYKFTPTFTAGRSICFILNTGTNNNPAYLDGGIRPEDFQATSFFQSPPVVVFAIYDPLTGLPAAGVTPTFLRYDDASGGSLTPPAITALGGGLYKFTPSFAASIEVSFVIDTASNSPPYLSGTVFVDESPVDATAPVVGNFVPVDGTAIGKFDPLQFDITDNSGALRAVLVVASFDGGPKRELVYDADGFNQAAYSGGSNTSTAIGGGFRFVVLRDGGWVGPVTIKVYAIDLGGNEAL